MIESEKFEQGIRPSAFAIAITFGGTVGLTISHKIGLSGGAGFLLGFFFLYILLVIAILKSRSDKRDELIAELENKILTFRKKIINSFIDSQTAGADLNANELAEDKIEQSELKDAIKRLRKTKFVSGGIRSLGSSVELKEFNSELDLIAGTLKKLKQQEKYKTHLKALEILKQEVEEEIRFLKESG
ncbi:MAG: hypothetical protein KZQ83_07025 [gamma proteobacterium symbiont of Taylorina sp.]|nr:hypothetical protein [gamma proteobacterium symbiont of Taylorina sp.]